MFEPTSARRAKLFRNAGNLAVRFPVDWQINADEAEISYDGTTISVTPIDRRPSVSDLLDSFVRSPVEDDWTGDPDDSLPKPVDL